MTNGLSNDAITISYWYHFYKGENVTPLLADNYMYVIMYTVLVDPIKKIAYFYYYNMTWKNY